MMQSRLRAVVSAERLDTRRIHNLSGQVIVIAGRVNARPVGPLGYSLTFDGKR